MSLFSQYIKERGGKEIFETEYGFVTYILIPEQSECYIEDIYVIPEKRKQGYANKLGQNIAGIAKSKGYKYLTGSVCPKVNYATQNVKTMIDSGFQILKSDNNLIWFVKEIQ